MLVAAVAIVMAAGVTHAWLRNSHVETVRAIDKTQQVIEEHKDAVNSLQVKVDKKLNIYQLRDDLDRLGSELVTVPVEYMEKIPAHDLTGLAESSGGSPTVTVAAVTP